MLRGMFPSLQQPLPILFLSLFMTLTPHLDGEEVFGSNMNSVNFLPNAIMSCIGLTTSFFLLSWFFLLILPIVSMTCTSMGCHQNIFSISS